MENLYFYQNNPCKIVRDINEDFAEVQIAHHFCSNMDTHGHCQGCLIGDSDNKLSCTCDDHAWIIEEFKNEENKVLVVVEKRLLTDEPVEFNDIRKLQECIQEHKSKLESVKSLHGEWYESLKLKQAGVDALEKKRQALEEQIKCLQADYERASEKADSLRGQLDETIVEITNYYSKPLKITRARYDELLKRDEILSKLEAGGVDNWEWYDESLKE